MMPFNRKEDSYKNTPPDRFDGDQNDWDNLSYDMQYYWWERKESQYEKRMDRIRDKRERVNKIKSKHGCRLCSEEDHVALVFHHLDEKEESVTRMVSNERPMNKIISEIEKCDVVCANCHRKIHAGHIEAENLSTITV